MSAFRPSVVLGRMEEVGVPADEEVMDEGELATTGRSCKQSPMLKGGLMSAFRPSVVLGSGLGGGDSMGRRSLGLQLSNVDVVMSVAAVSGAAVEAVEAVAVVKRSVARCDVSALSHGMRKGATTTRPALFSDDEVSVLDVLQFYTLFSSIQYSACQLSWCETCIKPFFTGI